MAHGGHTLGKVLGSLSGHLPVPPCTPACEWHRLPSDRSHSSTCTRQRKGGCKETQDE